VYLFRLFARILGSVGRSAGTRSCRPTCGFTDNFAFNKNTLRFDHYLCGVSDSTKKVNAV
jgi:hypothetical protein